MNKDTNIIFRVNSNLKDDFAAIARDRNVSISELLTACMKDVTFRGKVPLYVNRFLPPVYRRENKLTIAKIKKILENTNDEVPHCVYTEVEKYEETNDIDRIYIIINVEQESQKGIIIGKKASMIKKIGMESRQELEKIAGKKIFLDLQVKVKKDWRDSAFLLKNYGFDIED